MPGLRLALPRIWIVDGRDVDGRKTERRLFVLGAWTCVLQYVKVCSSVSTAIVTETPRDTQRCYAGKVRGACVIHRFDSPWIQRYIDSATVYLLAHLRASFRIPIILFAKVRRDSLNYDKKTWRTPVDATRKMI